MELKQFPEILEYTDNNVISAEKIYLRMDIFIKKTKNKNIIDFLKNDIGNWRYIFAIFKNLELDIEQ